MEIGSEFHLRIESLRKEKNTIFDRLNNYDTLYLNSGRSALRLITEILGDGEVLLPEYLCESVLDCFSRHQIIFYRLQSNLEIDMDDLTGKISEKTRAVYLMHYFGSLQTEETCSTLLELRRQKNFLIIEDTTHSIFSSPKTVGDYCICSLRKWFAIPDGGVLYCEKSGKSLEKLAAKAYPRNNDIEKAYGMILKTLFLDGIINSNSLYREIFKDSEKKLDLDNEVCKISDFSDFLLQCNDTSDMVVKRKNNYRQLLAGLSDLGISPISPIQATDCPFTLPIRIDRRDSFRQFLIQRKIYCAVHWPLQNTALYRIDRSKHLSEHIISLPIDQRYGSTEIDYLIKSINEYERIPNAGNIPR